MNKFFTQSPNIKKEYCCTIVKISDVTPIEGSDFLSTTLVNGFPVVVRRDQVKSGDLLFYVANECQLSEDFCRENNLYDDRELNKDKEKKGYLNKYGRVRIVKLRGQASMGLLISKEDMMNYIKEDFTKEMKEGLEFDMIQDKLFVKAFVPPVKHEDRQKTNKRNNKLPLFDRMIPGEFSFHYDTDQLEKNITSFKPDDEVTISVKLHGTSAIIGNIRTREPKWNNSLYIKYFNYLPKFLQFTKERYDYVCSSRSVIIDGKISPSGQEKPLGDVQKMIYQYKELISSQDILNPGMTIYGEIIGYYPNSNTAIQSIGGKAYDYGCKRGENKLMIYRITTHLSDDTHYEWDVNEIREWTYHMLAEHPDLSNKIHPIDVLYIGSLRDLYPKLDTSNHWHESLLENLKNDKVFDMEDNEPLCHNAVPREGLVIRKNRDIVKEAFKLKCMKFRFKEAEDIDKGKVDVETSQAY